MVSNNLETTPIEVSFTILKTIYLRSTNLSSNVKRTFEKQSLELSGSVRKMKTLSFLIHLPLTEEERTKSSFFRMTLEIIYKELKRSSIISLTSSGTCTLQSITILKKETLLSGKTPFCQHY